MPFKKVDFILFIFQNFFEYLIKTPKYKKILSEVYEIKNSKIAIYLESKTEKRTTHPDPNGYYCFEVKYPFISFRNINNKKKRLNQVNIHYTQ